MDGEVGGGGKDVEAGGGGGQYAVVGGEGKDGEVGGEGAAARRTGDRRGSGSFSTRVEKTNPEVERAGMKGGRRCRWGSEAGARTSTMSTAAFESRPMRY